ncbi:hypothetical protein PCANC_01781 [Puccinia coronata f. sp. avenae]|uniref:Anaphase-promoting complex subunit 3 n=1 Tax=Puccinia coronata f. sp. avenae TaxID=200324 RepID=A0A2N5W5E7_9BASI|nr:hypothetical protein PCANC_01781 [Puccinia coronata f. sp. avenae]
MASSNSLVNLLVLIILRLLRSKLTSSALFFAERLHVLIPSSELATYFLALCLYELKQYRATIHLLRNVPVYLPTVDHSSTTTTRPKEEEEQENNTKGKGKGKARGNGIGNNNTHHHHQFTINDPFNSPAKTPIKISNQQPANLASTRCALIYSKACNMIDRPKEGLEVYLQAIEQFGISNHDQQDLFSYLDQSTTSSSSTYTHLANLSFNSHEYEKANQFYRKALESTPDGHLCWEAFEGLCQTISTEEEVDPNQFFNIPHLDHFLPEYMELDDQYIICTPHSSSSSSSTTTNNNNIKQPNSNFNNLPIVSNAPIKPKPPPLAPKDTFRIMGTNGLYRHHKQMLMDNSFGDSSRNSSFVVNSFDHHPSYPPKSIQRAQLNSNFISHATPSTPNLNRPSPLPTSSFNFAIGDAPRPGSAYDHPIPISSTPNLRHGFEHNKSTSACNHPPPMPAPSPLPFYPIKTAKSDHPSPSLLPAMGQHSRGGLVSVKRTRSQTQSQDRLPLSSTSSASTTTTNQPDPDANSKPNSQPANPATITPVTTAAQAAKLGNGRLLSRREMLDSGRLLKVGLRETKRAKSNSNMTDPDHPCTPILSSAPDHQRPPASSFPPPSAASSSSLPLPPASRFRADKIHAIHWVLDLLRTFASAQLALSRFNSQHALDLLASLPSDQQRSWRVYCLIGKARFEMLDYKAAEIAFRKARESFPHLVKHMDIYSTLLWHLRKTTTLSYLSQELQLIDGEASETWIATGNLFSRLSDHGNALKCFQRATQLRKGCSYGYTLSGHESLMLAEYARSLVFFRESIRRNSRANYNAFFGLGECFFKQDRFRLALFFFNHAHKINPYNPLILAAVAKVYQAVGDLNPALHFFSQAVNVAHSSVASVRFSRAKILFELGEFEESKTELEKLVDMVPTEFNVRFLLGKIYMQLGQKNLAIKQLTFSIELDPKAIHVIKKLLEQLHHLHHQQPESSSTAAAASSSV